MNRREAIKNTAGLVGTVSLSASFIGLLQSCKETPRLDWSPIAVSSDHARMVNRLVDMILPRTSTPGGIDMKVDMFIDLVLGKMMDQEGRDNFVANLTEFNNKCTETSGKGINDLAEEDLKKFLLNEEKASPKFNRAVWGTAVGTQKPVGFYRGLKSMILWGYFTSEKIGRDVLYYDPIPQTFQGCISFSEIGKNYSL